MYAYARQHIGYRHFERYNESRRNPLKDSQYHTLPSTHFEAIDLEGFLIAHRLEPPQEIAAGSWWKYNFVHGRHHPFAVFVFHYRSLGKCKPESTNTGVC
jgi:hypothetical protein